MLRPFFEVSECKAHIIYSNDSGFEKYMVYAEPWNPSEYAGVPRGGGVKRQWGCRLDRDDQFFYLRTAIACDVTCVCKQR